MFSRFFIERPIFANVLAIVIVIIGGIALMRLPITKYPDITPPTITVSTFFPGASARILVESVARPIEEAVNGVEGMLYMQSNSAGNGAYSLTVTFQIGSDINTDQILVQNRVSSALSLLPVEVQRQGVTTRKSSTSILQVITLTSPDERYDSLFLDNYALINLKEELLRLDGVGNIQIFGVGSYAMRIWLNPAIMQSYNLTPADVVQAIQGQNIQVAAGEIGSPPVPSGQDFQYSVRVQGRLEQVGEFENIIVKSQTEQAGQIIRIKDLGRVELGSQTYSQFNEKNGTPSAGIAVFQLPGANALKVAGEVKSAMERLSQSFPAGLEYSIPFDTTMFVRASIDEVYRTLFEAIALVLVVILLFLQIMRTMIIPATALPVTILGAFVAMATLGYTINMVTMFALVLAIGIVVDDGIIIVEGVTHHMEQGLAPKEATIEAMGELSSPIYGITVVLMAVFVPAVFMSGVTGHLYRQFSLVIAATALISAFNALTLQPAQCVLYLKPKKKKERPNFIYRIFNSFYDAGERIFLRLIRWMTRHTLIMVAAYAVLIGIAVWLFGTLPRGFLPTEDQGYVLVSTELPQAASLQRTHAVAEKMNAVYKTIPGIKDWVTVGGISLLEGFAAKSNSAVTFVILENWSQRGSKLSSDAITALLQKKLSAIREATFFATQPPAIQGLGIVTGFEMQVGLKGGSLDFDQLQKAVQKLIKTASANPGIVGLTTPFNPDVPQINANVDRLKAEVFETPVIDVFNTLQAYLGSSFVNQFNQFGQTFQVYVQAEGAFRNSPEDIGNLFVRNQKGQMVPMGNLVEVSFTNAPYFISLYNLYPSAAIIGSTTPGFSSGQAISTMEKIADKILPQNMVYQWTGMSFQEKAVGHQIIYVFFLSVLLVFLTLAAQYESWASPLAVILSVPLAVLGITLALTFRGYEINVYTEIGIVLLVALASKNAILIVDYARNIRKEGRSIIDAAVQASQRRLRPILMTSLAFVFGVLPLFIATGAGATGRRDIGTAVIGGMLTSTFLAMLFVPVFFVITQRLSEWWENRG